MFGMGELVRQGTTINRTMGGLGVSLRDNSYINFINPAAISAHDSLYFMLDFGVESNNLYHANSYTHSAFNTVNMSHIVLSFPVYKKSAVVVGFSPYSHVGYKFEENEQRSEYMSELGSIVYQHYGEGSMNQLFLGASMVVSKNFSVGAEGFYYFGTLSRNSNVVFKSIETHSSIYTNYKTVMHSFAGKLGVQYEGKLKGRSVVIAGATVLLPTALKGDATQMATSNITSSSGTMIDTIYQETWLGEKMDIPLEVAVGVSFNRKYFDQGGLNRWLVGIDYSYQDWTKTLFAPTPGVDFSPAAKSSYKAGFEFTPDYFDARYAFRRWTYRGGVYYEQSYLKLNGQQVNSMGLTFGVSLPVYRSMLNFGIDLGQRGSVRDQLIRERYIVFQMSISLYDRWFVKMKYD